MTGVRPGAREVETRDGPPVAYDALLLALGARPADALAGALTFAGPRDVLAVKEAIEALAPGTTVVFVVPPGIGWTLPLYELALQTAGRPDVGVALVTPERAPLEAFGDEASEAVARRLKRARVALRLGARALDVVDGRVRLEAGAPLAADLVVALPRLAGPAVPGLPHDADGFAPVDPYCRVRGVEGVWAVGDMTAHPLKQGGLATQQADVAAAGIAAAAGADVAVRSYRPALRGLLLTGAEPTFLERRPGAPSRSEASVGLPVVAGAEDRRPPPGALPRVAGRLAGGRASAPHSRAKRSTASQSV